MLRYLMLFSRQPVREAREKGLSPDAAALFGSFAAGWIRTAHREGAVPVLATPAEDRAAWSRWLPRDSGPILRIAQHGATFGERLAGAVRRVADLGGSVVVVGGDVLPSGEALRNAFEALERGDAAVVAPSSDGGVSLLGLRRDDLDLLRGMPLRSREVFGTLCAALAARGGRVCVLRRADDVDGRRALRALLRRETCLATRVLLRGALAPLPEIPTAPAAPRASGHPTLPGLRAPPLAA